MGLGWIVVEGARFYLNFSISFNISVKITHLKRPFSNQAYKCTVIKIAQAPIDLKSQNPFRYINPYQFICFQCLTIAASAKKHRQCSTQRKTWKTTQKTSKCNSIRYKSKLQSNKFTRNHMLWIPLFNAYNNQNEIFVRPCILCSHVNMSNVFVCDFSF